MTDDQRLAKLYRQGLLFPVDDEQNYWHKRMTQIDDRLSFKWFIKWWNDLKD